MSTIMATQSGDSSPVSSPSLNMNFIGGGLILIAAALLYLLTLDNGLRLDELTGGDLITHQYAQVEARPSNAPGYPLYTVGGWLWFRFGQATLGWLLNPVQVLSLYSTLWGLASLLVLYVILLRVGATYAWPLRQPKINFQPWLIAALLTGFYATTFFFWFYSVTTEQYTSAVFQTLLIIWLALKWDDDPRNSTLLWLAFISGTMLANMVTTLFIMPPLLWFIFSRQETADDRGSLFLATYLKRPKLILQVLGAVFLPLLSYAYVYLRGAQHPEWRGAGQWSSTWGWFVQFLTIQQGRDELTPGLTLQNVFTAEFPTLMWHELTWPVFFGGLLGLAFLGWRRAIFFYSTLLIYFAFSWGYRFGNWFQVIIPAYPIIIIGFATALKRVSEWATTRLDTNRRIGEDPSGNRSGLEELLFAVRHSSVTIPLIIVLLLTGLLIYRLTASLPQANQHNRPGDTGLNPGWAILADNPDLPAVISGNFEEQVALQYLNTVWGVAPLIYATGAGDLHPPPGIRNISFQTYISRKAAAAAPEAIQLDRMHPQAAGEQLIALWPSPRIELPTGAVLLADVYFGDQLKLVGWEQIEPSYPLPPSVAQGLPSANWQIALYWQATEPLVEDYTVSVRPLVHGQLITVSGENIIQDHQPVWDIYPTSRWRPPELVRDLYALSLPPEVSPDAVQIVVYKATPTGFENLAENVVSLPATGKVE